MLGSLGGLLGSMVATRVTRRVGSGRASTALLVCAGPPALLIPLARPGLLVGLAVLGLLLVGVFVVAGNVVRSAWRQRYVPRALMGRVVTASQVVNFGTMPLAGLAAGWLGGQIGVRPTIALMAAIHAVACASILASPLRPLRELPASTFNDGFLPAAVEPSSRLGSAQPGRAQGPEPGDGAARQAHAGVLTVRMRGRPQDAERCQQPAADLGVGLE